MATKKRRGRPAPRVTKKKRRSRKAPLEAHAKPMALNAFAGLLSTVQRDVDTRLESVLSAELERLNQYGPIVTKMVRAASDLCLRGGKRLRAALVVTGYLAASRAQDLEPALDAGVAVELLHAYLLIHDDWMDNDDMRRGGPSVHAALGKRFRSQATGDRSAILAGDLTAAMATEVLGQVQVPPARLVRALGSFSEMHRDAVIGQQLDILQAKDIEVTYRLKTSSYTVRGPLQLGAVLGGAKPALLDALERYAIPAGIAFQLRDDLIGTFGDETQTGKPLGSDLKAGKRTLLLAAALKRARGSDRQQLQSVVGNPRASKRQLERALRVLEASGARELVERRIDHLSDEAMSSLGSAHLRPDVVKLLEGATRALTSRQR